MFEQLVLDAVKKEVFHNAGVTNRAHQLRIEHNLPFASWFEAVTDGFKLRESIVFHR